MGFFRNVLGDITSGPEVLHHVFGALSKVMHLAIGCGKGSDRARHRSSRMPQGEDVRAARRRPSQIDRGRVRRLAGLATWIAGIMPQSTAYAARLWAATATPHCEGGMSIDRCSRHEQSEYRATQQWRPTVKRLRRLCTEDLQQVQWHCIAET